MRYLILVLLSLSFSACVSDSKADGPVLGVVDNNGRLQENKEASARAKSDKAVVFRMGQATVKKGDIACLPVVAQEFKDIIGFQFTMRWDSTQLEYQNTQKFGLPSYGPTNLGNRFVSRGYLSTLWTDAALKGQTLQNGSPIFEVCFKNLASSGTESTVRFTDGPTTFEIIAADMTQRKLRYSNGIIKSK